MQNKNAACFNKTALLRAALLPALACAVLCCSSPSRISLPPSSAGPAPDAAGKADSKARLSAMPEELKLSRKLSQAGAWLDQITAAKGIDAFLLEQEIEGYHSKKSKGASQIRVREIIDQRPDAKGRKLSSRIRANVLIREPFYRQGKALIRLILEGRARIDHDSVRIHAKRIIIESEGLAFLKGGVKIRDSRSGLVFFAKKGLYKRQEQWLMLEGQSYVQSSSAAMQLTLSSGKVQYFLQEGRCVLEGPLHAALQGSARVWDMFGTKAYYLSSAQTLYVEQDPVVLSQGRYLVGDRLVYQERERLLRFSGKVLFYWLRERRSAPRAVAAGRQKKQPTLEEYIRSGGNLRLSKASPALEPKKEAKPILSILSADTALYRIAPSQNKAGLKKNKTKIRKSSDAKFLEAAEIEAKGQVFLSQAERKLWAGYLRISGKNAGRIAAFQGLKMIDEAKNIQASAGSLHYFPKEQMLFLRDDVSLILYQDGEPIICRADLVEHDMQRQVLRAQSKVMLQRKELLMLSELAHYYTAADLIVLEGAPSFLQGSSFVKAEKNTTLSKQGAHSFSKTRKRSFLIIGRQYIKRL